MTIIETPNSCIILYQPLAHSTSIITTGLEEEVSAVAVAFEVLVAGFEGDGWYFDFVAAAVVAGFAEDAGLRLPEQVFFAIAAVMAVAGFEGVFAPAAVGAFVAGAY